jgi:4-methyl-5(b-hydroxyethyl)-thiazole monophosphate biosynthesis
VKALRKDGRAAQLASEFHAAGKPVAAICAAPTIVHDAGLLAGRKFTSHDGVRAELPASRVDEPVVQDGLIITSQGAGTSVAFGLCLVRTLCGAAAEAAVREGIML